MKLTKRIIDNLNKYGWCDTKKYRYIKETNGAIYRILYEMVGTTEYLNKENWKKVK